MPPNREDLVIQRILIRHGFTWQMAEELLVEMQAVLRRVCRESPVLATAGAESIVARPFRTLGVDNLLMW